MSYSGLLRCYKRHGIHGRCYGSCGLARDSDRTIGGSYSIFGIYTNGDFCGCFGWIYDSKKNC